MSSAITALGQTRINELRGAEQPLVIDRMVLALVPGLDPTQPVDRNQQMPDPAHIVHTYQIPAEFKGYVDPDQVVYSMILGSDVGNFSFNWIGTVEAVTGNVITVTTTPETPKRKTDLASNTTGNNITRNVMMQFQDAQALTGVSISAETWQFDYTTWMVAKISEHDQDGGAHQDIRDAFTIALGALEDQLCSTAYMDLLGIVSQSGGTPTGAIIERGTNANGEYIRWADGTQICRVEGVVTLSIDVPPENGFYWGVVRGDYPAEFVDTPFFEGTLRRTGLTTPTARALTTDQIGVTTKYEFFGLSMTSLSSRDWVYGVFAIGRWY